LHFVDWVVSCSTMCYCGDANHLVICVVFEILELLLLTMITRLLIFTAQFNINVDWINKWSLTRIRWHRYHQWRWHSCTPRCWEMIFCFSSGWLEDQWCVLMRDTSICALRVLGMRLPLCLVKTRMHLHNWGNPSSKHPNGVYY
jgi:hypothetical protein